MKHYADDYRAAARSGLTQKQIAVKFGIQYNSVSRAGLNHDITFARSKMGRPSTSGPIREKIVAMLARPMLSSEMATKLGCSSKVVRNHLNYLADHSRVIRKERTCAGHIWELPK